MAEIFFTAFMVGNNILDIFLIKCEFCCMIKHARHLRSKITNVRSNSSNVSVNKHAGDSQHEAAPRLRPATGDGGASRQPRRRGPRGPGHWPALTPPWGPCRLWDRPRAGGAGERVGWSPWQSGNSRRGGSSLGKQTWWGHRWVPWAGPSRASGQYVVFPKARCVRACACVCDLPKEKRRMRTEPLVDVTVTAGDGAVRPLPAALSPGRGCPGAC